MCWERSLPWPVLVGWFRDVLPHEAHESVPVTTQVPAVVTISAAEWPEWRSGASYSEHVCRWRSIQFLRESRAVWREAWRWRAWRCFTGL